MAVGIIIFCGHNLVLHEVSLACQVACVLRVLTDPHLFRKHVNGRWGSGASKLYVEESRLVSFNPRTEEPEHFLDLDVVKNALQDGILCSVFSVGDSTVENYAFKLSENVIRLDCIDRPEFWAEIPMSFLVDTNLVLIQ